MKICQQCKIRPIKHTGTKRKFCSRECMFIRFKEIGNLKQGAEQACFTCHKLHYIPLRLIKRSKRHFCSKPCYSQAQIGFSVLGKGESHPSWKGSGVGYAGLHKWVKVQLGQPLKCEFCGVEDVQKSRYEWANKSRLYYRDISDWIRLCISCHRKYDKQTIKETV